MSDSAPTLNGDFPLTNPDDDKLGRKVFCTKLARILAKGNSAGSTVVAIYGDWGVGKTTAKNFTVGFLQKNHNIRPIEFEPWGWSGRDKILDALFTRLELALRGKELPKTKEWVEKIHRVLSVTQPLFDLAKLIWPSVGTILSFGFVWLSSTYALEREWINAGLLAIFGLGGGFGAVQALTKAIKEYNSEVEAARMAALDEVRADLVEELTKSGKALVVIIDDVDRLEPQEIRQVVQVVKAVANLPHVVFLLLFQRDVVTRALEDVAGKGKGQEFLEKVIQIGFHMPEPPAGRISGLLNDVLLELRKDERFECRWEQDRWDREFRKTVESYFRTARDVARFTSSLRVYLDQHFHQEHLEVNPVDLVALEVLRMFEPELFENLSAVPLIGPSELISLLVPTLDEFKEKREIDRDRLTKLAGETTQPSAGRLLRLLFPQLQEGFDANSEKLAVFDATQRVCHPFHYSKYFDLNLLQNRATDRDFRALMAVAEDLKKLRMEFQRIEELKLLPDVLARLSPFIKKLSSTAEENFVIVLAEIGEKVPSYRDEGADDGGKENSAAHITNILHQQGDSKRRVELCLSMFQKTQAMDVPTYIVRMLTGKLSRNDPMDRPIINQAEGDEIVNVALERIREDAKNGRLVKRAWFLQQLYYWELWGSSDETKAWAAEFAKDLAAARWLITAWRQDIISTGETTRRIPVMDGEGLDRVVGFEILDKKLGTGGLDKSDESQEGIALRLYSEAKKLKAANRPYKQVTLPGQGI